MAALDVNQQAAVNAAAVSASFEPDPSLSLLADPVYLPRAAGKLGGASVAPALIARMKEQGIVRGTCQTPREGPRAVPLCPAKISGYVVRFSEIFRLGTGKDSVEVYLAATRYRHTPKEPAEVLTFERAYQLARVRGEWRVMREARLPNTK
jgi:hypothetical protein